jgi:ATP-dependent Clp protease ATP-binding subunit ClpA
MTMFERFTDEARGAVAAAQDVARQAHEDHVDAVHLQLAIAQAPDGAAGQALAAVGTPPEALRRAVAATNTHGLDAEAPAALGIDLDAVRAAADKTFGADALSQGRGGTSGRLPLSPEAKKTVETALRETIRLDDRYIDSGHLLLAFLRLDETAAGRALASGLAETGTDAAALRAALAEQRRGHAAS